jgi:CRISPR-associated endonuclease/helicase Cas3
MTAYAHSKEGLPREQWHTLEDHLRGVADKASRFAAKFDSERWGWYAGLWHDLGKFRAEFQAMLDATAADAEADTVPSRVNHSSAGALLAMREVGDDDGLPLAFAIGGHHAGLADLQRLKERIDPNERHHLAAAEANGATAEWIAYRGDLDVPPMLEGATNASVELWIRMLFSALIDADRLDTECFHDSSRPQARTFDTSMVCLKEKLDRAVAEIAENAAPTAVNHTRARVLEDCRRRAAEAQGVFTLTVPTGGGKTLSSMAFALDHAAAHRLDRVIVVIPYTSIIEQNAGVLRRIFGDDAVVEHHSAFDPPREPSRIWLAAENWDAPIIVTTSVQFFESLFANRTSAARKLHNIARAVIIFDEVQTLPPGLLVTIVDGLAELASRYRSTVVLTTATQPALRRRQEFPAGFAAAHEIVSAPEQHFRSLDRVDVRWPRDLAAPTSYRDLAARVGEHERILTVVHLRNDARELALLVTNAIHLSALMCPVHRTEVLDAVRGRLKEGGACRVVATQLIEAGVDIDFPVVFRALGGLDSIAQAAGRCNREGLLVDEEGTPRRGLLEVFVAPTPPPVGVLRAALEVARTILSERGGSVDLNDPAIFERYFRQLYFSRNLDQKGIQASREAFQFATVAEKFQMIDSGWQKAIIIPYDREAIKAIETIRRIASVTGGVRRVRGAARCLQRYSVDVPRGRVAEMLAAGIAEDLTGTGAFIALKRSEFSRYYDPRFGLDLSRVFQIKPEDLIA